jgi:endoglucanase
LLIAFGLIVGQRAVKVVDQVIAGGPAALRQVDCTKDPAPVPSPPLRPDGRPTNYLHTCGGRLFDARGVEARLTGVNWSGMENSGDSPGGLGNRNWQDLLDQIAALGYNAIRIPFSSEAIESGQAVGNVDFALNPDLQGLTGLQVLDRLVDGARRRGLKVILDRHQPTSAGRTDLWYNPEVPEERWIADWQMLARRYRGNDAVVGVDLANEPHGSATWGTNDPATDWRLAAERAGNAVLAGNPYLLVLVEGVEDVGGDHFWWGGNLSGAATAPVELNVPDRLVYSPHDYGPAISAQTWFSDPSFPANLPGEWDRHWGYLARENVAPVAIGELGGWSFGSDADGLWQTSLLRYIAANHLSAFVWSLNPSWDTGGILDGDWSTVNQQKEQAYRPILAPAIDSGPSGVFGRSPTQPYVAAQVSADGPPAAIRLSVRVIDDGPSSLDLSQVALRYGTLPPAIAGSLVPANVTIEGAGANAASTQIVTASGRAYLQLSFEPAIGSIGPYREAKALTVHLQPGAGQANLAASANPSGGLAIVTPAAASAGTLSVYYFGRLVQTGQPLRLSS